MANNYLDAHRVQPAKSSFPLEPDSNGNCNVDQVGRHSTNGKSEYSDVNNYDHGARRSDQTRATSDGTFEGNSALRASDSQSKTLSMKEWMALALANATQQNNRPPVASEEYISAALKIGHSLAKQLCEAEGSEAPMKPLKDLNGSEIITVHLAPRDNYQVQEKRDNSRGKNPHNPSDQNSSIGTNNNGGELNAQDEVIGFDLHPQSDCSDSAPFDDLNINFDIIGGQTSYLDQQKEGNEGFDAMLNGFVPIEYEACGLNLDDEACNVEGKVPAGHAKKNIFDVNKAEILLYSASTKVTSSSATQFKEQLQRIHSLGIVFYELFSGGMRLDDLNNMMEQVNHYDPVYDAQYDPLDAEVSAGIDLSSALKLIDDLDFEQDNEEPVGNSSKQSKRARDNTMHTSRIESSFVSSIEHLKSISLPTCICDLVANMLDSINGNLSGEEAYQSMKDVQNDLEWMLSNSDRIISGAKPNAVVKAGLLTNISLYGQDLALDQLMEAYQRYESGDRVMALIVGASGAGKSRLAQQMSHHSAQSGGIFLSGKFDQLQQSIPFSAITSAFNEYCDYLVGQCDPKQTHMISSKLHDVLGQDISLLVRLIPNLKKVIGQDVSENDQGQGCINAQKRLQYVFCQFVDVISNLSAGQMTLFLDDLQWADSASIEVIIHLLLDSGSSNQSKQLFFLGCFREDDKSSDHSLWGVLSHLKKFGVHVALIQLACLKKECVNLLVSDMLCLPPRSTRSLSEIVYHKTKGNPQFVLQLIKALNNEGLLRLSLSRHRWEWDEEKIQRRQLPDDVAMAFTNTINQLSANVKEAMCIASCFGNCFEHFPLRTLERELEVPLSSALDVAVSEGLMDKRRESYYFAHDRVQEAAYGIIKPEDRCLHHFKFGLSLASAALVEANNEMIFIAVDQLNRGGPMAVVDKTQSCVVADLNLRAGRAATEMSDFATALNFFDNGISFLRKDHWKDHYSLSLDLYVEGTKCALAVGDLTSLNLLTEQVLTFGRSFEDKISVMYFNVCALNIASMLPEAIDKGVSVLAQLGVQLDQSSSWKSNGLLPQTSVMLEAYSDQELLDHREMIDETQIMSMRFLAITQASLLMMKPAHAPELTLKMVQLSLTHGMSPISPIAFVYYGSLLATCGEFREGYRFVKIAMGLSKQLKSREASSEVFAIASQVMILVEPLQSLDDFTIQGHKIGLASGNTNRSFICLVLNQSINFWGGKALNHVLQSIKNNITMMDQLNSVSWLSQALPIYKTTLAMIGKEGGIETAFGKCYANKETESETAILEHNLVYFKIVCFNKMYVAFMFRRFSTMKELAEKFFSCSPRLFTFLIFDVMTTFYGGLVSFWIARKTTESDRDDIDSNVWFEHGEMALSMLKGWAVSSKWNFINKLQLLEAEKYYSLRDMDKAKFFYNASILSATNHKFIHEEALACELASYFFSEELGQADLALSHCTRAHMKYKKWGALAKSNMLFQLTEAGNSSSANTVTLLENVSEAGVIPRKRNSTLL